MSSPDNELWQQSWRDGRMAFHQAEVNPLLAHYWSSLGLPAGSTVFVPLCGRSLDLVWLAEQGHQVIGCELSPVAVRDFFRLQRVQPRRTKQGALTLWQHGAIRIYCGDFFALTPEHLGTIAAVYDRAALTALPESARSGYVEHLRRLTPENCPVFLLTAEDPEEGETDDRFPEISSEITHLYRARFAIDLAHSERRLETRREADGNPPQCIELRLYRLLPY